MTSSRRPWYQFSLRTMFVGMTLVVGLTITAASFWYGMGLGFSGSRDETLQAEIAALFFCGLALIVMAVSYLAWAAFKRLFR